MRKRLFVDCDDTLVLYGSPGTHPFGDYNGDPWSANEELIEAVNEFYARDLGDVFIWSGGGAAYAQVWSDRFFDNEHPGLAKDFSIRSLCRKGDIAIDDQRIPVAGTVMTADEFVEADRENTI